MSEPTTPTRPKNTPEAADDKQNGPGSDEAAPKVLEDLEALRARAAERDQFLDLVKRTQADFENYQRRNQRERDQDRRFMLSRVMLDMLPVLDNLQRAMKAAQEAGETGPLVKGVNMVLGQFLETLRRHGVKPIEALGKPFDPNLHEAVTQQPAPGQPPNTVVQVLEQGFQLEDRVLRPAKVVVSAPGVQDKP